MSMDTGHPTHPLFKSMKRGWEDSSGEVRVLATPQLMGILATRIGEQAQNCLPFPHPRQELFSRLASVAGPTTLNGVGGWKKVARSTRRSLAGSSVQVTRGLATGHSAHLAHYVTRWSRTGDPPGLSSFVVSVRYKRKGHVLEYSEYTIARVFYI